MAGRKGKKEAGPDKVARGGDPVLYDASLLSDDDIYLFNEGSHFRLYEKLGAHPIYAGGQDGTNFAVWAPSAKQVYVMGDFNGWKKTSHPLRARGNSGIWEGFIPGVTKGEYYKYYIVSRYEDYRVEKTDPFGIYSEISPKTASIVWDLEYKWGDGEWMANRRNRNAPDSPLSIYEAHVGSWMRVPGEGNRSLTYRELAPKLAEYVKEMGFTHVEFLPVMEHPFYGSWGLRPLPKDDDSNPELVVDHMGMCSSQTGYV